jgi:hemolysin activation/secretion protein
VFDAPARKSVTAITLLSSHEAAMNDLVFAKTVHVRMDDMTFWMAHWFQDPLRKNVGSKARMRWLTSLLLLGLALALLAPARAPAQTQPSPPAPAAEEPRFDILEYVVEGNTVLSVAEIERAVTPFLGEKKTIADVESARKALEQRYQERGFQTVFVDIPEQRVTSGEVTLRVLEGRVDRVRVIGSRYFSIGEIRAVVQELAPGKVPDFNTVQQQLAEVNRTADRIVSPVLRAGRTPGTVEVDLTVKDQLPLHGDVELNNKSSAFTSESRLSASVRWDNLWQRQHSAGLNVQWSPEASNEVRVLSANYLWRFERGSDVLSMYAVKSDSQVTLVGSALILGDATIAGVRWVRPLLAPPGVFHSLTWGLDYKRFGQTTLSAETDEADVLGALDYAPLSLAYSLSWAGAARSNHSLGLTATSAPRGLLGNRDEEFRGRRVLARAGWLVLRADYTHERSLAPRWGLWTRWDALYASQPLVSNEQLALGGADSVRGYREGEIAVDRGARASVELRWWPWRLLPAAAATAGAPPPAPLGFGLGELQFYGLLDVAAGESDNPSPNPADADRARRWIGGLGLGLRWTHLGLRAQLEAARALNPGGGALQGFITDKGDWRAHLRLGYDF